MGGMTTTRTKTAKSILALARGFQGDTSRSDCPALGADDDAYFPATPQNLERETRLRKVGDHFVVTVTQHGDELGRAEVVQTDGIWRTDVIWQLQDDTIREAERRLREAVGPEPEAAGLENYRERRDMEAYVRLVKETRDEVDKMRDGVHATLDRAICDALAAGFSAYRLAQWTGLSQPTIAKARDRGRKRRTWTGLNPVGLSRDLARQTVALDDAPILVDARARAFIPDRLVVREISEHDGAHHIAVHGTTVTSQAPTTIVWVTGLPDTLDVPRLDDAPQWVRERAQTVLADLTTRQR